MSDDIFYSINPGGMPAISLCDIADVKPPYIHFRRKPQEYILYFILSGELHIREDSREYLLSQGDYILLDPEWEHEGLRSTACRFAYVHFKSEAISRCDASGDASPAPPLFPKSGRMDTKELSEEFDLTLYRLLDCGHDDAYGNYMMSSLLCELLGMLAICHRHRVSHAIAEDSRVSGYVLSLRHFLGRNYGSDISSGYLEEMFHCNFDYLNRVFKRETGDTIFSTLNKIRVENAKKYLATGLYTCSEAAARCGFHDVYYFSRVFKKYTGFSPAAYKSDCLSRTE